MEHASEKEPKARTLQLSISFKTSLIVSFLFVNFSVCRFLVLRREKQADTEKSEKREKN